MDFTINQSADLTDQVKNATQNLGLATLGNATVAEKCMTTFVAGKPSDFRKSIAYIRPAKQTLFLGACHSLSMAAIGDMTVTKYYEANPIDVPTVGFADRKGLVITFSFQPTNTPTRVQSRIKIPYLKSALTDAQIDGFVDDIIGCLSVSDYPDLTLSGWSKYLC